MKTIALILAAAWLCCCSGSQATQNIDTAVRAIDGLAQVVCGPGDPLLTCLDKIERSSIVAAERRAALAHIDGGAR